MSDTESEIIEKTLLEIKNVQSLIDNYELNLIGLRASPNDEFTHKEIKRTEVWNSNCEKIALAACS